MKYSPQKGLTYNASTIPSSILIHGDHAFCRTLKLNEFFEKNAYLSTHPKKIISETSLLRGDLDLQTLLSSSDMFQGTQHIVV